MERLKKISSISVILEFDSIQYIDKIKKKWMLNLNYVKGMKGKAYLQFNGSDQTDAIQVTVGDDGLEWFQKRTENMEPPKPIREELKQIWDHPNEGFGLLGLAVRKSASAVGNTLFGPIGGAVIQEARLDVNFKNEYSVNNMSGERTKPVSKDDSEKRRLKINIIEDLLNKSTSNIIDWLKNESEDKKFECLARYNGKDVIKFIITVE